MLSYFSMAQSGMVTYTIEFLPNVENELSKKMENELDLMEFTLSYDKTLPYFNIEKSIPIAQIYYNVARSALNVDGSYFQLDKKVFKNVEIAGKNYLTDYSFYLNGWDITGETAKINEFTCYKAIYKRENKKLNKIEIITAWFTVDIPASYGLVGFGGLPGLILQLEFKNSIFTVNNIVLNPKRIKIPQLPNHKIISVQDFVDLSRASRKVTPD